MNFPGRYQIEFLVFYDSTMFATIFAKLRRVTERNVKTLKTLWFWIVLANSSNRDHPFLTLGVLFVSPWYSRGIVFCYKLTILKLSFYESTFVFYNASIVVGLHDFSEVLYHISFSLSIFLSFTMPI